MGGILVGVLAAVRFAHQIQDLIIVVLPVCPVQAQSRRCFWVIASKFSEIGMTGLTSWAQCPDLEPFRCLKKIAGIKKPAITGRFFIAAVLRAD
ncbi:hypothetical protein ABH912_004877 [Pseudomonas sp. BT76 TE3572]|uniref:hypothetical protein n=1 Tax=Pseudomonas sp. BT76 TE3572 TaxID=3349325 RepID=UPI003D1D9B2A